MVIIAREFAGLADGRLSKPAASEKAAPLEAVAKIAKAKRCSHHIHNPEFANNKCRGRGVDLSL